MKHIDLIKKICIYESKLLSSLLVILYINTSFFKSSYYVLWKFYSGKKYFHDILLNKGDNGILNLDYKEQN